MSSPAPTRKRCAIYTRKSSEEGLEQSFNSLHAQREACEAFAKSQCHEGWEVLATAYDDGGFSGGNTERPALVALLDDIRAKKVDVIIVYKVDRLSRSLADFVRLVDLFEKHGVSFVSVTQQFNTSTSMGRLTLNVLLSFAQFEREVTSERIRDKLAASRKKGLWMGGQVPLGYDAIDKQLMVNKDEAALVQHIYKRYLKLRCVRQLKTELDAEGYLSKNRLRLGKQVGRTRFSRGALYLILRNPIYIGKVAQGGALYKGAHKAILDEDLWDSVQAQLKSNWNRHVYKTDAKDPSLLAGLLFDDKGNRMSPGSSKKGVRRYRNYVSQALLQYREKDAGSVSRISASTIENIVIQQLVKLLQSPVQLDRALGNPSIAEHERIALRETAAALATDWKDHSPSEQLTILRGVLEKIVVGRAETVVTFSRKGLASILRLPVISNARNDGQTPYEMRLSVSLKRSPQEARLIVANDGPQYLPAGSATALLEALLKAFTWNEELIRGAVTSMNEIAVREGVTQRYIAHLLELVAMAPDSIDKLAAADARAGWHLTQLKRGVAHDWSQQFCN